MKPVVKIEFSLQPAPVYGLLLLGRLQCESGARERTIFTAGSQSFSRGLYCVLLGCVYTRSRKFFDSAFFFFYFSSFIRRVYGRDYGIFHLLWLLFFLCRICLDTRIFIDTWVLWLREKGKKYVSMGLCGKTGIYIPVFYRCLGDKTMKWTSDF